MNKSFTFLLLMLLTVSLVHAVEQTVNVNVDGHVDSIGNPNNAAEPLIVGYDLFSSDYYTYFDFDLSSLSGITATAVELNLAPTTADSGKSLQIYRLSDTSTRGRSQSL